MSGGTGRDGEADFLTAHPKKGALTLEVKGGEVRYEAKEGAWLSRSRDGQDHRIKDPFEQAKDAKYSLRRFLRDQPAFPRSWGPFGHGACFPDAVVGGQSVPHADPAVAIDARDMEDHRIRTRVDELFEWWSDDPARPTQAGFDILLKALAHDLHIRQPLGVVLDEADREIVRLSRQQFSVLNVMAGNRRVAVAGPAGSGKTLIAVEKAKRLAAQGMRVLRTCFNRPLADYVRESLKDTEGIDVSGFHRLCFDVAAEAGVKVYGDRNSPQFWTHHLPRYLARGKTVDMPL